MSSRGRYRKRVWNRYQSRTNIKDTYETPSERTWRLQYGKSNIQKIRPRSTTNGKSTSYPSLTRVQKTVEPTADSSLREKLIEKSRTLQKSHIVDLEDLHEAPHDHLGCQCTMSFPFLNLDPAIRKRIFRFVLLSDDHMLPFYNFGSLELPNHLLDADFSNIDVGLALSNKQLNIEGTDVLYGENTFDFSNADVAIWWFRRVGRNVAKVRKAYFYLDCGEINHLSVMKEKMWLNFFNWLAPRHQLKKVFISFEQWKRFKEYNSHGKTCIGYDVALKAQNETADVIKKFRNLINVTIAHGHYLNLREVRDMENQMTRKKEINVSITKDEEGELRLGEALVAQVAIRERVAGSTVA